MVHCVYLVSHTKDYQKLIPVTSVSAQWFLSFLCRQTDTQTDRHPDTWTDSSEQYRLAKP